MKELKKTLNSMAADISEMKDTAIEILRRLDELGFAEPMQKPQTAFKVIKGGLSQNDL